MSKQKKTPVSENASVETVSLYQTARQRYLNYALSVITSRALPDVRDGMKPVQRRILYGMNEMHLTHETKFQKCAQIVGQVMGRYHPHGDSAIYEALVRLAQPFTLRYPFVDGQGNFGSLDGDTAAAMRYTEARLQPVAAAMLDDLDEHIVDFEPNYSGTLKEPTVLPTAIPTLLVNGSMGIAVGMATNVPPHNLTEVLNGCIAAIDKPSMTLDALIDIIPGPDFPTGGRMLTKREDIKKIYETGRGPVDIQSDYTIEKDAKHTRIIITSIPYTVNKAAAVKAIGDLISSNKMPLLTNIHDESKDDVRIVMDLRSGANPDTVMAYLFKHTQLQTRFNVNITCIVPGGEEGQTVHQPRQLGLRECIDYFNTFRLQVVTKRMRYQLSVLEARIHILEGYLKLFDGLDEAVSIIRESEDRSDASRRLCARFSLDDIQADAILELKLYRLARMEIDKIQSELSSKSKEAEHLRTILSSEKKCWKAVRDELVHARDIYGDARRTQLEGKDLSDDYNPENYIIDEDCYVIITKSGLVKRQKSYTGVESIRTKEKDAVSFIRRGTTRSPLLILTSRGKAYTMLADSVPATTGHGSPLATMFKFDDGEMVIGAYILDSTILSFKPVSPKPSDLIDMADETSDSQPCLVSFSKYGQTSRLPLEAFTSVSTSSGRIYMRLNEGDEVISAVIPRDERFVSIISDNTRANVFPLMDVPSLKAAGKGFRAIALDPGTCVAAARLVIGEDDGVRVRLSDRREITISVRRLVVGGRGGKGRLLLRRGSVEAVLDDPLNCFDPPPTKSE